eukprot:CAMPEP_0114611790 /NCGR_PEP_ID=MMETSP0168-20121206/4296_1 /TAXON_ID=95228 ORGANISM="Vannella sp., Strain DIVA3 517/6/12" /NCGR_SAMPLE_ID=MMETSP0168 /ASSEMBLY_ACC=CAM_ASM_000044 /LENGTH=131 /DNA_ID=CAMNT_0001822771 /DNA_START=69 /DNA_END=462 /DNA_ORIENTATION=+
MTDNNLLKIKDVQLKYGLSDTQIENITEQFNRYDLDHDGRIVPAEVKELMMKIQLDASDSAVSAFIHEMDRDENGSIELWEFIDQVGQKVSRQHSVGSTSSQPFKRARPAEEESTSTQYTEPVEDTGPDLD